MMNNKRSGSFFGLPNPTGSDAHLASTMVKRLVGSIFAIGLFLASIPAQATLIYDLTIDELLDFSGSGQIEFTTYNSSDPSAAVSAFSFSGTGAQGAFSFSLADIAFAEWSIDTTSDTLDLDLETGTVLSSMGANTCVILDNTGDGGTCGGILTTTIPYSRVAQQVIGRTTTGLGNLLTTAVNPQPIPAPGTLVLLTIGLMGLGMARSKHG
jgi:hypothetical protein